MRKLLLREEASPNAMCLQYSFVYVDPASKQHQRIDVYQRWDGSPIDRARALRDAAHAIRWFLRRKCGEAWLDPAQPLPLPPEGTGRYVYA